MNNARLVTALLIVLVIVWFVPWQSSAVMRVYLATAVFCLPGALLQQWIYGRDSGDLVRHISVGFAASVCVTAILGIIAKALGLTYIFVVMGLFAVGGVSLVGIFMQTPDPNGAVSRGRRLIYVLAGIALVGLAYQLVMQLGLFYSYNRGVFVDDYSYAALTTKFRTTGAYSFAEIMHNTGYTSAYRTLFAMLPLSYAVIAELSGLTTFEFFLVFRPVEVFLFIVALIGLARALRLSWGAAVLVVVIQALIVALNYRKDDIFSLYPEFLQDKGVAAYVLVPVFMRVMFDFLEAPGRNLFVLGITALAVTFTHPTMVLIMAALAGCCLLVLLITTRRWQPILIVGVVLIIGALPHVPLRILDQQHQFSIETIDADLMKFHGYGTWENRMGDFEIYDYAHNLYGLKLKKFDNTLYALFFAAVILSLFRVRRSRAAVFLVGSGLLWASVVFPVTGALWGMAITPLHLRRVIWLIPLALAAAYVVDMALAGLRVSPRRAMVAHLLLSVVVIGVAWGELPDKIERTPLASGRFPPFYYHEIESLSERWKPMVDETVVTMGTKRYLNNVLPMLLPQTKIFYYRNIRTMMRQNNIPLDEASDRSRAFVGLTGDTISFPEAWDLLDEYEVEYILADQENTRLVRMLLAERPDQFVLVLRTEHYRLYRIEW